MADFPSFGDFFEEVHGVKPFKWQERAAKELASSGWWPALTAPTGAGKTALIDAWLWALASAGPERLGRRLFWVVDRRAVVDQVHEYAQRVIEGVWAIESLLTALSEIGGVAGDEAARPVVGLWRGGLDDATRDESRTLVDASRVAVVCSTVDQVGSRLLFRGYGLRKGSRAAHAGLVGTDATIVLDEAHLSEPLRQTLARVREIQCAAQSPPRPATRAIPISATPTDNAGTGVSEPFVLTDPELSDSRIARRLRARKTVLIRKKSSAVEAAIAARELASQTQGAAVGIVMNTVAHAREAFEALRRDDADAVLLIGPVRPLDRVHVASVPSRDERSQRSRPFYIVATQTIEVGVDLDLDGLVTACAPVPSLIQRLGRVDRFGSRGESMVVVLAPPKDGCPVYGDDTRDAWDWLLECGARETDGVDLGPDAIARIGRVTPWPRPSTDGSERAPVLLPLHVESLSWIDGGSDESPDVDLFLHGVREVSPDVALVWRKDIPPEQSQVTAELVSERLGLRPPHSGEALPISLGAARRWLGHESPTELADVPTEDTTTGQASRESRTRSAWRVTGWSFGSVEVERATPGNLRPGDTIVVAASAGGCDRFGWAPGSSAPVSDLGSLNPRRPRLVLWTGDGSGHHELRENLDRAQAGEIDESELRERIDPLLEPALPQDPHLKQLRRAAIEELRDGRLEILGDGEGVLVVARRRRTRGRAPRARRITLLAHQDDVAQRVHKVAGALRLDPGVSEAVRVAALHHDEGKRDPRFQAWLTDGAPEPEPLAKSTHVATPRRIDSTRRAAGWPAGKRHEIASALLIDAARPDLPLAAWLALTHHGRNRPHPQRIDDPAGRGITLTANVRGQAVSVRGDSPMDAAWAFDLLEDLTGLYGPWGLALLEAMVMTADHAASREAGT